MALVSSRAAAANAVRTRSTGGSPSRGGGRGRPTARLGGGVLGCSSASRGSLGERLESHPQRLGGTENGAGRGEDAALRKSTGRRKRLASNDATRAKVATH